MYTQMTSKRALDFASIGRLSHTLKVGASEAPPSAAKHTSRILCGLFAESDRNQRHGRVHERTPFEARASAVMMRVAFLKRRQHTFASMIELRLGLSGAGGGAYTYDRSRETLAQK